MVCIIDHCFYCPSHPKNQGTVGWRWICVIRQYWSIQWWCHLSASGFSFAVLWGWSLAIVLCEERKGAESGRWSPTAHPRIPAPGSQVSQASASSPVGSIALPHEYQVWTTTKSYGLDEVNIETDHFLVPEAGSPRQDEGEAELVSCRVSLLRSLYFALCLNEPMQLHFLFFQTNKQTKQHKKATTTRNHLSV